LGIDPPPAAEGKLADWLQERSAMTELIRQHLVPAQDRMKKQADKNRTECEFAVRAMVYLKLQSYVQSSVLPRANLKLSFKYFGPFKVLERTGNVDHSAIHPVIHVSQLKLAAGFKGLVSDQLPSNALQYRVPMQVLQSRLVDRGSSQVMQVPVRWSELPASLATWEDKEALQQKFPRAPGWGHVALQAPGNVNTEAGIPAGPRQSTRPRKANPAVIGPQWKS
jgi:hypothetical protein